MYSVHVHVTITRHVHTVQYMSILCVLTGTLYTHDVDISISDDDAEWSNIKGK